MPPIGGPGGGGTSIALPVSVANGGTGVAAATGYNSFPDNSTQVSFCTLVNTLEAYSWFLNVPITFLNIGLFINVADAVNNYDIGFYNAAGNLLAHTGAMHIPSTGAQSYAILGAPITLLPGLYFVASTGNATTSTFNSYASVLLRSFSHQYGSSAGGALPASITAPTAAIAHQNSPAFVLF